MRLFERHANSGLRPFCVGFENSHQPILSYKSSIGSPYFHNTCFCYVQAFIDKSGQNIIESVAIDRGLLSTFHYVLAWGRSNPTCQLPK